MKPKQAVKKNFFRYTASEPVKMSAILGVYCCKIHDNKRKEKDGFDYAVSMVYGDTEKECRDNAQKMLGGLLYTPVDQRLLTAVEFGYMQCEKGHNIQHAVSGYQQILNAKTK